MSTVRELQEEIESIRRQIKASPQDEPRLRAALVKARDRLHRFCLTPPPTPREPALTNPANLEVAKQAATLSSGTIAVVSGQDQYEDVVRIQSAFVAFVQASETAFECWQDAWAIFWGTRISYRQAVAGGG